MEGLGFGREWEKKQQPESSGGQRRRQGAASHSIDAFLDRLRDRCGADFEDAGLDRNRRIEAEAVEAVAIARGLGCLIESTATFEAYCLSAETWAVGTEHVVELSEGEGRFVKLTKPFGFGVVPGIKRVETKSSDPSELPQIRAGLEFFEASPMEYLKRWRAANELFGDDVRLVSVVQWKGGDVSFVVTQPQYHGVPADEREIERFFQEAGWERLRDPSGHMVFYNYAFGVIAVDAAPRNCYINEGGLQPFDVILCEPDEVLAGYLGI